MQNVRRNTRQNARQNVMPMLRGLAVWGSCLLVLGLGLFPEAGAEVAVRTDRFGDYVATQVIAKVSRGELTIWGQNGRFSRRHYLLNPDGDRNGDLWPLVVESNHSPHYPWVVWSRLNGEDYDLAWSRWTGKGWSAIGWVEGDATSGDDLDPDVSFDATGRAYMVWSREENGVTRIYLSVYLVNRWMTGFLVSDSAQDSRYPTIVNHEGETLEVEYRTNQGTVRQIVAFSRPVTITDDINPLGYVRLLGAPRYVGGDSTR